jgi:hypothetical protein
MKRRSMLTPSPMADTLTGNCGDERTYDFHQTSPSNSIQSPETQRGEHHDQEMFCPCCGSRVSHGTSNGLSWSHNVETCRLVNLALSDMGIGLDRPIRVNIYRTPGPLKGYYSLTDPHTINISEEAYSRYPEYVIFHETKHLVDCVTKGWSEEETPDPFARALCAKHGFETPPQHANLELPQFPYTPWPHYV